MARKVTLFTGQWADLPLEVLAKKASEWGYDGLELACWGDHMNLEKAANNLDYCKKQLGFSKITILSHGRSVITWLVN